MKNRFLRSTLVKLCQIHYPLLDNLLPRNPGYKRADLIRMAIEEFVVNHPDWDPDAFTAAAKKYAKEELDKDAQEEFWDDHRRILSKAGRAHALPHAKSLDLEVSAEDFDV